MYACRKMERNGTMQRTRARRVSNACGYSLHSESESKVDAQINERRTSFIVQSKEGENQTWPFV